MTNGIASNNNRYMVSNTGIDRPELQGKIEKAKQSVTTNVESNSAAQIINSNTKPKSWVDTAKYFVPIYMADKLVDTAIGGKGNGLLGKIAQFGDKISNIFRLNNIISKKSGSKISNFIKKNRFTKYFTNDYKAIAKSSMAKSRSLTNEFTQKLIEELNNAGLNVSEQISVDELIKKAEECIKDNPGASKKISILKNKLSACELKLGKTGLGNILAKGTLRTKDVLTYGGGILGLLFTVSSIKNTIKETKEAPKGEKLSTFMHVLSEQYLGILLFQPSISLMYRLCGNKYRGMTLEGRNALKELIKAANSNPNITKEGVKVAKLQRDLLLKGVDKNKVAELAGKGLKEAKKLAKSLKGEGAKLKFWEKPLKSIGKILSTGLDKIHKPKVTNYGKFLRKILDKLHLSALFKDGKIKTPATLGGFAGGFARFAIIMFVLQPLLQKPLTKLCHKIFGEPKTYLAKNNTKSSNNDTKITAPAVEENPTNETNFLKLYSQRQTENQQQANVSSDSKQMQNSAPLPAASVTTPIKPQNNNEDPAAALNLSKKSNSKDVYIPSINVNIVDEIDPQIHAEVQDRIKANSKFIKNVSKKIG